MLSKVNRWILGVILLHVAASLQAAQPQEYMGKVDHVYDGQTVRIFYRGGQIRVRLPAVENPDSQQTRQTLARLVAGKTVRVKEIRWDQGYLVGHLLVDNTDVAAELARAMQENVAGAPRSDPELGPAQHDIQDAADLGTWAQR